MCNIGFSLQDSYCMPMEQVLSLLHRVGFDAISPTWQAGTEFSQLVVSAEDHGLFVQSLHGPFRGLPGMWSRDTMLSEPILQALLQAADACASCQIPTLVVHSWGGIQYEFQASKLYFDNFDRLVEHCLKRKLQVAFENLEGPEFLDVLLARYNDPSVGLCWDSGHELCYTPSRDFIRDYGDRLLMTHINDNYGITSPDGKLLGTDDLHLIPGDGIADQAALVQRLKGARQQDTLNFELKIRPKGDRCTTDLYSKMPLEQYLTLAYDRALQVAAIYTKQQ